jgi:hypothetical protein
LFIRNKIKYTEKCTIQIRGFLMFFRMANDDHSCLFLILLRIEFNKHKKQRCLLKFKTENEKLTLRCFVELNNNVISIT